MGSVEIHALKPENGRTAAQAQKRNHDLLLCRD